MERSELVAELMTRIGSIKRLMHAQRYTCNAAGETVSGPQVALLFATKKHGSLSQHELAKHLFMTPGGVSQLVEQLIDLELIVRTQSTTDRRSYELSLSEAGRSLTDTVAAKHQRIVQATTADISDHELAQFVAVLDKIADALQANNEEEKE